MPSVRAFLRSLTVSLALVATPTFANSPPSANSPSGASPSSTSGGSAPSYKVLILGGGVSGIIAARTLHSYGINDFLIIDARSELGGRMQNTVIGNKTIELGPNWIQGTQEGDGPANPILELAEKHKVVTQSNDVYGSLTTYDQTGHVDYLDKLDASSEDFEAMLRLAGRRVARGIVDVSSRTGLSLVGAKSTDPHYLASEYFLHDWEFAQTPEQSSLIASAWNNNYTYDTSYGGFSEDNLLSIDQRGFKTVVQLEAKEFLNYGTQVKLNSTVTGVDYRGGKGVVVTLQNGEKIRGDYALCTFSVGVLQHDDVKFEPVLPEWKEEAIQGFSMNTYTKIFLQFPTKFWFDTENALYADPVRGKYPVWQSLDHENFFPGSGILFVTVTGDESIRLETLSTEQVKSEVMAVVRAMFPNTTEPIPEPLNLIYPKWNSDPLFRGSYSNWPPSFSSQHMDNLQANIGRLWFSGEHTSREFFGFLHGAFFEGRKAGERIAACVKKIPGKTCTNLKHWEEISNALLYQPS